MEMPRKWGGFFRNDAEHRDFTAIGTAAGAHLVADLGSLCSSLSVWHIIVLCRGLNCST